MVDRTLPLSILQTNIVNQAVNVRNAAAVRRAAPGNTGRALASTINQQMAAGPSLLTGLNAGTVAYLANSGTNTISLINLSNFTKIKDITVGNSPAASPVAMDISPNGYYLYVVNSGGTLTLIDITNNTIKSTIDLPGLSPSGVKVSSDGRYLYVVYYSSPIVSIIDTVAERIIGSISLPDVAFGIDLTTNSYAYATLRNSNQVAVVDLIANTVIKLIRNVPCPENITIWRTADLAFVSDTRANAVSVINTDLAVAAPETIPAYRRPAGIAVDEFSGRVYVALSGSRQVEVIDTKTASILPPIDIDQMGPEGIAITPDGNYLVVANSGSGTASLVNLTTNRVESTIPTGAGASFVVIARAAG